MGGPDPGRGDRAIFRKRAGTLVDKAHALASLYGAKVYLVIDHPRATVVYNSVADGQWPPPEKTMEPAYPHVQRLTYSDMEIAKGSAENDEVKQLLQYYDYRSQLLQSIDEQDEGNDASEESNTSH
ncbi:hypothetical protein BO86DRAFT_432664 [Aspergillus japonicus CBS 114.51]|uniref:MADS-box domain-containing protein n=1 Tax=Aspergillus japonicus CBS 114.51 TaxID=1448312 RepID=A0A8T8WYY2_ASPJA|nr:hypothetical protein BO86DRAFT_432664 [Aspergillus japonicus CBS 114.51]RAH80884.1 hypothetical protein BO86DRAFT_432664 [Aspergillus japonicus CBS 114.51]